MQISFSLPESQFVAESPEAVTQKIRLYAALGPTKPGRCPSAQQANWQA
jgi:hypothetical protein